MRIGIITAIVILAGLTIGDPDLLDQLIKLVSNLADSLVRR